DQDDQPSVSHRGESIASARPDNSAPNANYHFGRGRISRSDERGPTVQTINGSGNSPRKSRGTSRRRRSETDRPASLPRGIDRETIVKAEADHGDRGGYSRGCGAVARVRRGRRGHGDRRHGHGLRRRQDGRCGPPAGARTGARREPAAMNLNEKVLTRADRIILGGELLTL